MADKQQWGQDSQHEQMLASISSAYRSSHFSLLLYVTEFEVTLRHEQSDISPLIQQSMGAVVSRSHSSMSATPVQQQATARAHAEFCLLRFHDLIVDYHSASQSGHGCTAPNAELMINSTFVDGFRLEKDGSLSPSPPRRELVLVMRPCLFSFPFPFQPCSSSPPPIFPGCEFYGFEWFEGVL